MFVKEFLNNSSGVGEHRDGVGSGGSSGDGVGSGDDVGSGEGGVEALAGEWVGAQLGVRRRLGDLELEPGEGVTERGGDCGVGSSSSNEPWTVADDQDMTDAKYTGLDRYHVSGKTRNKFHGKNGGSAGAATVMSTLTKQPQW